MYEYLALIVDNLHFPNAKGQRSEGGLGSTDCNDYAGGYRSGHLTKQPQIKTTWTTPGSEFFFIYSSDLIYGWKAKEAKGIPVSKEYMKRLNHIGQLHQPMPSCFYTAKVSLVQRWLVSRGNYSSI